MRALFLDYATVSFNGDLDPACRFIFNKLMEKYGGDWSKVVQHVRVKRLVPLALAAADSPQPEAPLPASHDYH